MIIKKIYNTAEYFNMPVYLQGSLGADEKYPHHFLTYWIPDSDDNSHYDNKVNAIDWSVQIIFYSDDMNELTIYPQRIADKFKQEGFIPQGGGNFIASDEPTHTGWTMDFFYTEKSN